MSNIFPGLETAFNTVAEQYDRMRPTYVDALYDGVWKYGGFGPGTRAVEVGIGTGQATQPVLDRGASVTAVELGPELAAFCARKFSDNPGIRVVNLPFQDFDAPDGSCDLVYSASAFHWIPEELGYRKVFRMLRPGGVFARFANHPFKDKEKEALHEALQTLYAKYMPRSVFFRSILRTMRWNARGLESGTGLLKTGTGSTGAPGRLMRGSIPTCWEPIPITSPSARRFRRSFLRGFANRSIASAGRSRYIIPSICSRIESPSDGKI